MDAARAEERIYCPHLRLTAARRHCEALRVRPEKLGEEWVPGRPTLLRPTACNDCRGKDAVAWEDAGPSSPSSPLGPLGPLSPLSRPDDAMDPTTQQTHTEGRDMGRSVVTCVDCGKTAMTKGRGLCSRCYDVRQKAGTLEERPRTRKAAGTSKQEQGRGTCPHCQRDGQVVRKSGMCARSYQEARIAAGHFFGEEKYLRFDVTEEFEEATGNRQQETGKDGR